MPYRLLAEAEDVEIITWRDPGAALEGVRVHAETQAGAVRRVTSGGYRAVICGLNGRIVLPGSYLAARARGIPFVLWATVWAHPRTPFHALSYLPARHLYRNADAVVTYGPHISAYVRRYRTRGDVFEAAQAVDVAMFSRPVPEAERQHVREALGLEPEQALVLFVGRIEREKGVEVLLRAWQEAGLSPRAALVVVGEGPLDTTGARRQPPVANEELPAWYAAADVVVVPSIGSRRWLEPWALVVNEAMLQGTPVVASDCVGAVRGGLVRDGENGLVVPSGSSEALAGAIRRLVDDEGLRARLGHSARAAAARYTPEAWVSGMSRTLVAVGASLSARDPRAGAG